MRTLLSSLVLCLAVSPLHAVTPPWVPFGPDGGDARRIATDPSDHAHLYLGAANGWIYESHNSGASWVRLAQVGKRDDLVLDSIVVDAKNPRHLIVGAWVIDHPDGGIFISNDAGATWINQAEMRGQSVRALAAYPADPNVLVAGSLQGVFRSTDGGLHWNRISPEDNKEIHEVQSVAIDPADPNVIYAGTWHLPWKTTDGGEHWDNIKHGIIDDSDVFSIIVDPTQPKIVYASACSGIYKSEDAGTLFHKIQGIPSTARRTRVLKQDPQHLDTVFAGTTEGLYRSEDAGKTWVRTTGPDIVVNDVSIDPADPRHILIATNRGGVLSSDDDGDNFHTSNGGFSARQITALKTDSRHPATLYVGVVNDKAWGGVFQSDNGGINWAQRSAGLEGRDVFSLGQAPDGTMIAGTAHGLYRLDSTDQTWKRVEDAPGELPSPTTARPTTKPVAAHHTAKGPAAAHQTPAQRKAALLKAKKKPSAKSAPASEEVAAQSPPSPPSERPAADPTAPGSPDAAAAVTLAATSDPQSSTAPATLTPPPATTPSPARGFDGSVYSLATASRTLLAATSRGLLTSTDDGVTWLASGPRESVNWRLLAAAKDDVVAASLHSIEFSPDAGVVWSPVKLPEQVTQISAIAVEPSGTIWVGSREGVFLSSDAGNNWTTLKNLYVNNVNNIFYDASTDRMTVTIGGASSVVFTVQLPQKTVTYADTGWNLRFARPVGDHLVAVTYFDGIVVQPRMLPSPLGPVQGTEAASTSAKPTASSQLH